MKDVAGKVAFITGGSSGIGLGIARAFVDADMKVVITYRTQVHLDEAMQYFEHARDRVHAIRVDVDDRPGLERAAEETIKVFGRVHVLVNNAGVQLSVPLAATKYEDWDRLIGVNVTGVFNSVHVFLPRIQAHGEGGQIIATSSIGGLFAWRGAYCASKFAVVGLMEGLRAELADTNIGVSAFCPGLVKSNLEAGIKDLPAASDPLEIGRLVLRGMQNNDLYILTHPEFAPIMQRRHEVLMDSIPQDLHPPEVRLALARSFLPNSIYMVERDRRKSP